MMKGNVEEIDEAASQPQLAEEVRGSILAAEIRRMKDDDLPIVTENGSYGKKIEIIEGTSTGKCGNKAVDGVIVSDIGNDLSTVYNKGMETYIYPNKNYYGVNICDGKKVIGTYYSTVK